MLSHIFTSNPKVRLHQSIPLLQTWIKILQFQFDIPNFYPSCLWQQNNPPPPSILYLLDETQKYVPARAGGGDKLEPWNYSFSCWEEKESSVSLADIPLNLIHYCVVTLLSLHAVNWASCGALKYPDGGQDSQHSMQKKRKEKENKGP